MFALLLYLELIGLLMIALYHVVMKGYHEETL